MQNEAIFTDLYQIAMLQSYWKEGMDKEATFDLFLRRSKNRNFFLVSGVNESLKRLQNFSFNQQELDFLQEQDQFKDEFIDYLENCSFTCDIKGVKDGTVMYPSEPILEVTGPLPEAQLVETILLNQIGFSTNVATKAAHIIDVVEDQTVADFGMRRAQGFDAAMKGARSMYIAGVDATSNVAAGEQYGIPITGTMAHSYVEAHDRETDAFRNFTDLYDNTVVLVDTYDTLNGVRKVIDLMNKTRREIGGVRLDSGDLAELSIKSRQLLNKTGYSDVKIFASSSLDENKIQDLQSRGAEIDGYGVGTKMATVADQPYADAVYKLCGYDGKPRMKLSSGKSNLPGKKEIFRSEDEDVIAAEEESKAQFDGKPLYENLMVNGNVTTHLPNLESVRNTVERTEFKKREVQLTDHLDSKTSKLVKSLKASQTNGT